MTGRNADWVRHGVSAHRGQEIGRLLAYVIRYARRIAVDSAPGTSYGSRKATPPSPHRAVDLWPKKSRRGTKNVSFAVGGAGSVVPAQAVPMMFSCKQGFANQSAFGKITQMATDLTLPESRLGDTCSSKSLPLVFYSRTVGFEQLCFSSFPCLQTLLVSRFGQLQ